jgi:hypothetical protein
MGFVPIGIDEFIKLHRKSNPGERPDEFKSFFAGVWLMRVKALGVTAGHPSGPSVRPW